MRRPRVRFTVRRMMAATAVVAVGLAALLTFGRLDEARRKFHAYDHDARFIRKTIWLNEKRIEVLRSRGARDPRAAAEAAVLTAELRGVRRTAEHLERLRQHYASPLWQPWSLAGPDPPPPEL